LIVNLQKSIAFLRNPNEDKEKRRNSAEKEPPVKIPSASGNNRKTSAPETKDDFTAITSAKLVEEAERELEEIRMFEEEERRMKELAEVRIIFVH
jgi:hypothetical protein